MTETETTPLTRTGTGLLLLPGTKVPGTETDRLPSGTGTGTTITGTTGTEVITETVPSGPAETETTGTETTETKTPKTRRFRIFPGRSRSRSAHPSETKTETTPARAPRPHRSRRPGRTRRQPAAPRRTAKVVAVKTRKSRDWTLVGMWSVIIVMNVMALLLASSGQIEGTWKWAGLGGDDPRKWLLPGVTEVGYIGFLMLGRYALRRNQSPFLWWGAAALAAAAAVFMNSVHGPDGYEFEQGLIFGTASTVSLVMTFAKFLIDYRAQRQRDGHTTGLRPRALTLSSIWFLPLAIRAHLIISRCDRVKTREQAYELAEQWRWIYQDTKAKEKIKRWYGERPDTGTAKRTAWITVYQRLGMVVPALTGIKVAKVTFVPPPPPPAEETTPTPAPAPAPTIAERVNAAVPMPLPAGPAPRRETPTEAPVSPAPTGAKGLDVDGVVAGIKGLPEVPADVMCGCRRKQDDPCGWTLREHIARKASQVEAVLTYVNENVPDWATRTERVGTGVVKLACEPLDLECSKNIQNQVAWIFDDLRKLAGVTAASA